MKRSFCCIIKVFTLLMIFTFPAVNANIICNDGTESPSCGDCHRGCCSHHGGCSNGASNGSSRSSGRSNYVPQQPIIKEKPKSSDASLKKVTINDENINISDSMSYLTTEENVHIYAAANDTKATTDYDYNVDLAIGDNDIVIKVTAENGDIKEYKINIVREKVLSNNKNIKIRIKDEEVVFNSFESKIFYLNNSENKIDIKYELEDKNAKAEIIGNENLKVGKNKVIVRVTAENGEKQDYIINVERSSVAEEVVSGIIGIGFFAGIGYLTYYFIKKFKKK